ncbi:hypothetical protein [Ureibacillus endophyticus]|uniref:Uncharacterized protein n=1 Tax=Ureibacillus endophyticus TaxID=1978490 RepID=A0A494Z764_9BACL|nr:hypothetical protein [Lysinibacillus endophyticus]RKQ18398.1 hypothetical protein D8M03_05980 [Lysinibacillus endophyticus]
MKKVYFAILLLFIFGGGLAFIKFNPPIEIGTLGYSEDNKSVVVGIGNNGFRNLKIVEVVVNQHEKASDVKIQKSNALQGFIVTDDFRNVEAKEYVFTDMKQVSIKSGTSPSANFEKLDEGMASENDEIYGISVIHPNAIHTVHIKYKYFGMSFNETVEIL